MTLLRLETQYFQQIPYSIGGVKILRSPPPRDQPALNTAYQHISYGIKLDCWRVNPFNLRGFSFLSFSRALHLSIYTPLLITEVLTLLLTCHDMNRYRIPALPQLILLILAVPLFFSSPGARAAELSINEFINEFTQNYYQQKFLAQTELVKKHGDLVPKAVNQLIEETKKESKSFEERMFLLNIASAMAYMQRHLHGRFLGNFVMKQHGKALEEAGLAPVLYPHWKHRLLFECKVCHNSIFRMQRWTNRISQKKIVAGEQCGVCHDGEIAFSANNDEYCGKCHIAGKPEAEKLHNPDLIDHAKIKEVAERVGAQWHPENLNNGRLPVDRFGLIDWLKMKRDNVFVPIASLQKDYKERTRDNKILFISKSNFVNNVLFDHKVHSDWIDCSSCHPAFFRDKLGGNDMKMRDMSKGRYCGHCHGKVSFKFADCKRCHSQPPNERVDALIRVFPEWHFSHNRRGNASTPL